MKFSISPDSFFQLNLTQTIKLYDKVKEVANLSGNETLVDLYCGIGSIGLYLADSAKKVYGIDNNESNIKNAKEFAELNNISNAEFSCTNILKFLENHAKSSMMSCE